MINLDELQTRRQRPDWLIPQIRLRGGESARFRFLIDYPEIKAAPFHVIPTFSASLGRNIFRNYYCLQQDGQPCKHCDAQALVTWRWHAWVWCYFCLRSVPSTVAVEPVQRGSKTFYKEVVNGLRLLRQGPGRNYYIIASLKTYHLKHGTLCDRDYELSRQGTRQDDTTYAFTPEDKTDVPSEAQEALNKVLSIEEYIKRAYSPDASSPGEGTVERLEDKLKAATETAPENIGEEL